MVTELLQRLFATSEKTQMQKAGQGPGKVGPGLQWTGHLIHYESHQGNAAQE